MGFLDRFRRDKSTPTGPAPSAKTAAELTEFMRSREGVEGYVEPRTSIYSMSLCLVAADGEHIRRPVKDENQARSLCSDHGVPIYDARIVGYPKRMREYSEGTRRAGVRLEDLPPLEVADDPERRDD